MYDELVKSLRICGDSSDPIAECCYEDCTEHECPINPLCMQSLCYKAADAIEELSSQLDDFKRLCLPLKENRLYKYSDGSFVEVFLILPSEPPEEET